LQTRSLQVSTDDRAKGRTGSLPDGWQEAVEREISVPELLIAVLLGGMTSTFMFPSQTSVDRERDGTVERRQEAIAGTIVISAESVGEKLFRVSVHVQNMTPMEVPAADRDAALSQSLVSTHTILGVKGGAFVSLLEPPPELQELAADCKNVGAWPVLVGEPGQRDTVLASPIILYDYPQIAPESPGDLFDGTEIDEILSLRIMTLTDEEKREIRESDDRTRQILERTDAMPAEQFMKLHGAMRSLRPLKEEVS
jgi:hydrogenase maturation protease